MALRVNVLTLHDAFKVLNNESFRTKTRIAAYNTKAKAGQATDEDLYGAEFQLTRAISEWTAARDVTGLTQWAKDQVQDNSYNIVQEINTVITAATSIRDWILANIAAPGETPIQLSAEETAGFSALADSFDLTITVF